MAFWFRSRYADIRPGRKIIPCDRVQVLVPHSGESKALEPLIERISERMCVSKVERLDSRERVQRASKKLTEKNAGREYDAIRQALLRLDDAWARLSAIAGMLASDKGSAVLELHCLEKDYKDRSNFKQSARFLRLNGTRVLMPSDYWTDEFFTPINESLALISRSNGRASLLLGCFEGLDMREILKSKDDLLGVLSSALNRTVMIEVPAGRHKITDGNGLKLKLRTLFEKKHLKFESDAAKLSEEEVESVLSVFNCSRIDWPVADVSGMFSLQPMRRNTL